MPESNESRKIDDDLFTELREHSTILDVYDQAQDIVLDLHEEPFNPEVRDRALSFLQSPDYVGALNKFTRNQAGELLR